MNKADTFNCPSCDHDASKNKIWPPFECILEDGPTDYAKLSEEERVLIDTTCFHTKLNAKQTALGTGLAYSRKQGKKEVERVYTALDYVSLKAYREGLRKAINKKKFTHWIPLCFGPQVDDKEKLLNNFRRAVSQLSTNRDDQFNESLILKTIPQIIITLAVQVLADKAYSSIKGIRMLLCFHRAFLFLL